MKVAVTWEVCGYVDIPEAKTVEEAITEACIQLGLASTDVEVEVIEDDIIKEDEEEEGEE